jgi:hypothetical protein
MVVDPPCPTHDLQGCMMGQQTFLWNVENICLAKTYFPIALHPVFNLCMHVCVYVGITISLKVALTLIQHSCQQSVGWHRSNSTLP